MEQEQTQLDAMLGSLDFDAIVSDASDVTPEHAAQTETPSEEEAVAPPETEDSTESADDAPETTDAAAPTPSDPETPTTPPVDYDSDANPYKAEAAEARRMRELLEAAAERYQQQQAEQARQTRETEIAERIAKLSEEYTPEQAREQARRIRAEVEDSVRQEYDPQISERESVAIDAAKHYAALKLAIDNAPDLTPKQRENLIAAATHVYNYDSPDAMQSHFQRESAIVAPLQEQLTKAMKKIEELTLAQQAQKRIASGADTAGAGVGRPAAGGPLTKTDEAVNRALASVGL